MVDARHWLALARTPGGRATLGALLDELGTPEALFTAPQAALRSRSLPDETLGWLSAPDWAQVDADLAWLAASGTTLVVRGAPEYPALLAATDDPPLLLFVRGHAAVLQRPQLAVVGSRNPTPLGARDAHAFADALTAAGLVITSGLALGIDGAAHQGALDAGGITIAVCATGLDRVYPAAHRALAARIIERGALVSEFPPGTHALRHHFPLRNRIIAGLSLGTLVVEAAAQSGSLITARLAGQAGREVFAIPGSIRVFAAAECERLDVAARGFIINLEQIGILSPLQREVVIDKIMALEGAEEIDLEQAKWIILMVLFNQPGQEDAYERVEDIVFADALGAVH